MTAFLLSGCSYIESTDNEAPTALSKESIAIETGTLESQYCLTFGYRNWLLQRDADTVTLGGEASMPTPAWTILLHQDVDTDNETIELVMETIEPSGFSSSVVSWVAFETIVKATTPASANVTVTCAGDVVWNSLDS